MLLRRVLRAAGFGGDLFVNELESIMNTEKIELLLKQANKVFEGDLEYDGAGAARIIIDICSSWLEERKTPPSFEVAEQIVKDRMLAERENLKSKYGGEPYISFSLSSGKPGWTVYPVSITDTVSRGNGFTLSECLSDLPSVRTTEQIKAERIAELESELAELKAE